MSFEPPSKIAVQAAGDPDAVAHVLVQALPHIRRFAGRTVVVKMGGGAMTDPALDRLLAQDVLLLKSVGVRVVLVHGGGPQIDDMVTRLGLTPEFRDGLRVTDAETLDIVRTVLVGKINRELVAAINREEPVAIGVAGEDAGLLRAAPRDPALGFVGDVTEVNASVLHRLLDDGLTPVVSTVGADASGQAYNINADAAASAIAAALGAEKLIYLTAAPGLLEDATDDASLIHRLSLGELRRRMEDGTAGAGMIPKLRACCEAVEAGVGAAHILDGRVPHSILIELLTDAGIGTMITADGEVRA
jgi:acetylglutamate kinase